MKNKSALLSWLLAALLVAFVFLFTSASHSLAADVSVVPADATTSPPVLTFTATTASPAFTLSPDTQTVMTNFILMLVFKYPMLASIIAVLGTMRAWAKPVSSIVHSIVDLTPSTADNGILNSVLTFFHENPIGKVLAYLIDWFASIKITPPVKTVTVPIA